MAFEERGRESFVPAGASSRTDRVNGPGTPRYDDAEAGVSRCGGRGRQRTGRGAQGRVAPLRPRACARPRRDDAVAPDFRASAPPTAPPSSTRWRTRADAGRASRATRSCASIARRSISGGTRSASTRRAGGASGRRDRRTRSALRRSALAETLTVRATPPPTNNAGTLGVAVRGRSTRIERCGCNRRPDRGTPATTRRTMMVKPHRRHADHLGRPHRRASAADGGADGLPQLHLRIPDDGAHVPDRKAAGRSRQRPAAIAADPSSPPCGPGRLEQARANPGSDGGHVRTEAATSA